MSELNTIRVAAAIISKDGAVLACKRSQGEFAGMWEFPGGKVKEGETAFDACRREVLEELGAKLSTTYYYDTVEYDYPTFHLSMDCYVCFLAQGEEPQALEHEEIRWVTQEELASLTWLPADQNLVQSLAFAWDTIFATEPF